MVTYGDQFGITTDHKATKYGQNEKYKDIMQKYYRQS